MLGQGRGNGEGTCLCGKGLCAACSSLDVPRAVFVRSPGWCCSPSWSQGSEPAEKQSMKPSGRREGRGGEKRREKVDGVLFCLVFP